MGFNRQAHFLTPRYCARGSCQTQELTGRAGWAGPGPAIVGAHSWLLAPSSLPRRWREREQRETGVGLGFASDEPANKPRASGFEFH